MLRTALYIRVSTEEQALHGYSLEAQREALTKYAKEHDLLIIDYYMDDGYTARKSYTKRKEFMRMMDDVKADKLDLILFIKLDRWFRSVKDYYKVQEVLEAHHVDWKTVYENYDTTTASGRLHINIMLSVAQDESDRTSERIKFVFQDKVRRGEVITGSVPLGYKIENKRLVPVENEADIVRDLFAYYDAHQSIRGANRYLREAHNLNMSVDATKKMLKNRTYIGEYRGVCNFCEPILKQDLFERVNDVIKSRNVKACHTKRVFLFSSLLTCAECGHRLASVRSVSGYVDREYFYYRCEQYCNRRLCSHSKLMSEEALEAYLLENIMDELKKYITLHKIAAKKTNVKKFDAGKIKKKIDKLRGLYLDDLIDIEAYREDYDALQRQLQEAESVIDVPTHRDISNLETYLNTDVWTRYATLDREGKRMFWRSIIKEIRINKSNEIEQIFFA